jgi:hypothetical protein
VAWEQGQIPDMNKGREVLDPNDKNKINATQFDMAKIDLDRYQGTISAIRDQGGAR